MSSDFEIEVVSRTPFTVLAVRGDLDVYTSPKCDGSPFARYSHWELNRGRTPLRSERTVRRPSVSAGSYTYWWVRCSASFACARARATSASASLRATSRCASALSCWA